MLLIKHPLWNRDTLELIDMVDFKPQLYRIAWLCHCMIVSSWCYLKKTSPQGFLWPDNVVTGYNCFWSTSVTDRMISHAIILDCTKIKTSNDWSHDLFWWPMMDRMVSCGNLSLIKWPIVDPFRWSHNKCDGISNHQRLDCLLSCLFWCRSKKTSKLCITGLCEGNSPVTGEYPAQRASNTENVSIWWHHHAPGLVVWLIAASHAIGD